MFSGILLENILVNHVQSCKLSIVFMTLSMGVELLISIKGFCNSHLCSCIEPPQQPSL